MLFVSLINFDRLDKIPKMVDGIECRLDLFPHIDLKQIKQAMITCNHPFMFTVRKASQGGGFCGTEKEREALIEELLQLEPLFFDLEYETSPCFLERIYRKYDKTRFILSYHHFQETPFDLEGIYREMLKYRVYGYKIATEVLSTNDALRLLLFARNHSNLSAICMGEKGAFARILGPIIGNLFNYACLNREEKTASGQLTADELIEFYNFPRLNQTTPLYGFIGDPSSDDSHYFHHDLPRHAYVKMRVTDDEIPTFLSLAKEMGFRGLRVATSLQEKLFPFIDVIDSTAKSVGTIDTLLFQEGQIYGFNNTRLFAC